MGRSIIFLLILALFWGNLLSQDKKSQVAAILKERGEVYVGLKISTLKSFQKPSLLPGFDKIEFDKVFLYLTSKDSVFLAENLNNLEIQTPASMQFQVAMSDDRETVLNGKAYPTYKLYLEIMEYFRDSFPEICTIDTIGYSSNGRLMLAARMGKHTFSPGEVPVVFYGSTIHGDEPAGYVFMLMLIHHILSSSDPNVVALLENLTIIIHPLINPDGCYFTSNETIYGATRGNARGVDLNRNFPDPQDGPNPDGNSWQLETVNMMNYHEKFPPGLSANFHGGSEVINYPFDTWSKLHADHEWFRFVSSEYAGLASSLLAGYMDEFPGGITNGFDWYEIDGGRQDYVTYFLRGRETTIELSDRKLIPESELLNYWNANREPMLNYLRQAMYGIHGTICDAQSSKSIAAEVFVIGRDTLNSSIFSDSLHGRFFRYLEEGGYKLKISARGYKDLITGEIKVNNYEKNEVSFKLLPLEILPETDSFSIGPNPFLSEFTVFVEMDKPGTVFFRLYDVFGQVMLNEFATFPAGYFQYTMKPKLADGIYFLEIMCDDVKKILRLVKVSSVI